MTINKPIKSKQDLTDDAGVTDNQWQRLREFTAARISLGRSGVSIPTSELLAFQLAHAQARDAVHTPFNFNNMQQQIKALTDDYHGLDSPSPVILQSQASDRSTYLQRPDLGRRLHSTSRQQLLKNEVQQHYSLAIVVADGLSATAIFQNAQPFIQELLNTLKSDKQSWSLAPVTLIEQGRVAIGDEVGELVNADVVLVLIGERPGLSSPDSMGLYLTWKPRVGLNDSSRNCISNVRPDGLVYAEAVNKTMYLLNESRRLQLSGVNLKDRSNSLEHDDLKGDAIRADNNTSPTHFLSQ